jgi:hypothetical protein
MPIDLEKELARLQDRKAAKKKEPSLPLVQKKKPGTGMSAADLQRELGLTSQRIVRQQVASTPAKPKRSGGIEDLWAQIEKLPSQAPASKPSKPSRTRPKPPPQQQEEEGEAQESFDVESELEGQEQEEAEEREMAKLSNKPIPPGKLAEWEKKGWKYTTGGMPAGYPVQKDYPISLQGLVPLTFDIVRSRDREGKVTLEKVSGLVHPDVSGLAARPAVVRELSEDDKGTGRVWVVTHLPSGYALGNRVRDPKGALLAIGRMIDWTQGLEAVEKACRDLWKKGGGKAAFSQSAKTVEVLNEIANTADPYFVAIAKFHADIHAQEQRKRTKYQTYVREMDSDGMAVLLAPIAKQVEDANRGRGEWPKVVGREGISLELRDLPVWQKQHLASAVTHFTVLWEPNVHIGSSPPPPLALSWPGGKPTVAFPLFKYKGMDRALFRQKPLVLTGEAARLADRIKAATLVHFRKEAATWKTPLVPRWYEEDRSVIDALTAESFLVCRTAYSDKQSKSPHAWFACVVEYDGKLWVCDHITGGGDFIWSDRPLEQSMKNHYAAAHEWGADPSRGDVKSGENTSAVPVLFLDEVVPKANWKFGTFGHREREGARPGEHHVGEVIEVRGTPFVRTGRTRVVHRALSIEDLGTLPGQVYYTPGAKQVIIGFRKKPEMGKKKKGSHDYRTHDPRGLYAGELLSDGSIRNIRWFEGGDLARFRPIYRATTTETKEGIERAHSVVIDPKVLAALRQKIPDLATTDR